MSIAVRPEPLREAATDVAGTRGVWMGLLSFLVSGGMISASTGSLLGALVGLIPGALTMLAAVLGAFGVARQAEPKVTPISDPMTVLKGQLVPLVPAIPAPPTINIP